MSIKQSEAVLLQAFNWSESSRTVLFLTKEFGKIALTDRGGRSMKSKRGRIVPFSRMEVTYYNSEKETNGYISEISILEQYSFEKDGTLGRLAYASAACELLKKLMPEEEAQVNLYNYLVLFFKTVDTVEKKFLPSVFTAFMLRALSHLGYHPSLAYCVGCSKDISQISKGGLNFSGERGGFLCSACQKAGDYYIGFSQAQYKLLLALQTASLSEASTLPVSLNEATMLLEVLLKFLEYQTGMNSSLKSLGFLEKLKNSQA